MSERPDSPIAPLRAGEVIDFDPVRPDRATIRVGTGEKIEIVAPWHKVMPQRVLERVSTMHPAHTPGPWVFVDSPAWGYAKLWNPQTQQDVLLPDGCNDEDDPETWMGEALTDPDKWLIEAAPDLFDALLGLIGLVQLVAPTLVNPQRDAVEDNPRMRAAWAAINKATGAAVAKAAGEAG